jgi:hypothetical protein
MGVVLPGAQEFDDLDDVEVGGVTDGETIIYDSTTGVWQPGSAPSPAWTSYTPTWTATSNPAIGNGSLAGKYRLDGKTLFLRIQLQIGSTTTLGSGNWTFGLPASLSTPNDTLRQIIPGQVFDATGSRYACFGVVVANGSTFTAFYDNSANTIDSDSPIVWANTDYMLFTGVLEVA